MNLLFFDHFSRQTYKYVQDNFCSNLRVRLSKWLQVLQNLFVSLTIMIFYKQDLNSWHPLVHLFLGQKVVLGVIQLRSPFSWICHSHCVQQFFPTYLVAPFEFVSSSAGNILEHLTRSETKFLFKRLTRHVNKIISKTAT